MNWVIKPYESVGPIRLGEQRVAVRRELGDDYDSFEKAPGENPTDAYDKLGVHLYYDNDDRLEYVEAFEPALLELEDNQLVGSELSSIRDALESKGYSGKATDCGYQYDELGVALTVDETRIEGVGVFRRGYYGT